MFWITAGLFALGIWVYRQSREVSRLRESVRLLSEELRTLNAGDARSRADTSPPQPGPWQVARPAPEPVTHAPTLGPAAPGRLKAGPRSSLLTRLRKPGRPVGELLAEKGLAWAGGAGLALGGALLVGYMAQQGWFTPPVRLLAAALLGAGLIVFGELVRRRGMRVESARNPLVAALGAGSGSAVLYAASWAAHGLYDYFNAGVAALLLSGVSGLLLFLALRHGQALALLALGGAYCVPWVAGLGDWGVPALPGYLGLVLATGTTTAVRRQWDGAAVLSVSGAVGWGLLSAVGGDAHHVFLALAGVAASLAVAEVGRRPTLLRLASATPVLAAMVLGLAAILHGDLWAQVGLTALLTLGATALARRISGEDAFAALALIGAASLLGSGLLHPDDWPSMLAYAAVSIGALLLAGRRIKRRLVIGAAFVATSAALLGSAAGVLSAGAFSWVSPAMIAALLAAAAWTSARERGETLDGDWWAAAAAASALVAVLQLSGVASAPAALAGAALALAAIHLRASWLGVRMGSAAAAVLALGAGLNPAFIAMGWSARPPAALLSASAAAGTLWVGSRLLRKDRRFGEGVSTTAVGLGLIAAFIALNWFASRGAGRPLDELSRAALNGLLLLGAGLAGLASEKEGAGRIAAARSRVLLGAGVLFAMPVTIILSPWWGASERVIGAPLVDSLLLAYLAPAVLLGFAADRLYRRQERWTARAAVGASVAFAVLWVLHLVRRLADGPAFRTESVGFYEAAAYAVAGLAAGLVFEALRRRRQAPAGGDMWRVATVLGWAGLVLAAVLLGLEWSPWWGGRAEPLPGFWGGVGMLGAYIATIGLSLVIARVRPLSGLGGAGRVSAVLHALLGLTLAVRFAYRGPDLRPASGEAGLETWTYSAAWAVLGVAVLVTGDRRGDAVLRWCGLAVVGLTLGKVLLFDLTALEGVARAGSFLAVGALLLLGPLLAKRRLQT